MKLEEAERLKLEDDGKFKQTLEQISLKIKEYYETPKITTPSEILSSENSNMDVNGTRVNVGDKVYAEVRAGTIYYRYFLTRIKTEATKITDIPDIEAPQQSFTEMSYSDMYEFVKKIYTLTHKCQEIGCSLLTQLHKVFEYYSNNNEKGGGLMQILYSKFLENKLKKQLENIKFPTTNVKTNVGYLWFPATIKTIQDNTNTYVVLDLTDNEDQVAFSLINKNIFANRVLSIRKEDAEEEKNTEEKAAAAETQRQEKEKAAAAETQRQEKEKEKEKQKQEEEMQKQEAEQKQKDEKTKLVKDVDQILGENWEESLKTAIENGLITNGNSDAAKTLLSKLDNTAALDILRTSGVNELHTFLSKIVDTNTSMQKFVVIVNDLTTQLDKFVGNTGATRKSFVIKIKKNFNIDDSLHDEPNLPILLQKCPDCIRFWKEMSKNKNEDLDINTVFESYKREFIDFKKYVLTTVYELTDETSHYNIQYTFDSFLFLCYLLEYMHINPSTGGGRMTYFNLYKNLNLSRGTIKIKTDNSDNKNEDILEIKMFEYFKQLLSRGIGKAENDLIDEITDKTGDTAVSHVLSNYIILVSCKYLMEFNNVCTWIWWKRNYNPYPYMDFLTEIKSIAKTGFDVGKSAATILLNSKYMNDNHTKINEHNNPLSEIEGTTDGAHIVLQKLLKVTDLNDYIMADANSNKNNAKTVKRGGSAGVSNRKNTKRRRRRRRAI